MDNIKILVLSTVIGLNFLLTGCSDSDGFSSSQASLQEKDDTTSPVVGTPAPAIDPYRRAGWFARTGVQATDSTGTTYEHRSAGVFGALVQSSDGEDQHDVPGYGAALLQVIFLPDFSTDTVAGYYSEYKYFDLNDTGIKKSWTFQVKNQNTVDLSGQKIVIDLQGAYDVTYRDDRGQVEFRESSDINTSILSALTLVDVDYQTSYTVSELPDLNLTMNDASGTPVHTRTFRWVYGAVDTADYAVLPAPRRAAARVSITDFQTTTVNQASGKFGLPPQ